MSNNNNLLPIAKSIRQELVSLTVSLDDKKQLLFVLREKIENKRLLNNNSNTIVILIMIII